MREDVTDVGDVPIEMNRGDQPEPVAADIEHEDFSDPIDAAERGFQIGEMREVP
jgi:hypothetical protein